MSSSTPLESVLPPVLLDPIPALEPIPAPFPPNTFTVKRNHRAPKYQTLKDNPLRIPLPRNSWVVYLRSRDRELAHLTYQQLMTQCKAEWRKMTPEQKKPYVDMYKKDKERYALETETANEEQRKYLRARRKLKREHRKEVLAPARRPNGYLLFCQEYRTKNPKPPTENHRAFFKRLGSLWRNLPSQEKQKYIEQSRDLPILAPLPPVSRRRHVLPGGLHPLYTHPTHTTRKRKQTCTPPPPQNQEEEEEEVLTSSSSSASEASGCDDEEVHESEVRPIPCLVSPDNTLVL